MVVVGEVVVKGGRCLRLSSPPTGRVPSQKCMGIKEGKQREEERGSVNGSESLYDTLLNISMPCYPLILPPV